MVRGLQDGARRRLFLRVLGRHRDAKVAVTAPAAPWPPTINQSRRPSTTTSGARAGVSHLGAQEHRPVAARPRPGAELAERGPPRVGGARHPQRPASALSCPENPVLRRAPGLGTAGSRTGHAQLLPAPAPVGGKLRLPEAGLAARIQKKRGRRRSVRAGLCRPIPVAMASGARRPPEWRSGVRSVRAPGRASLGGGARWERAPRRVCGQRPPELRNFRTPGLAEARRLEVPFGPSSWLVVGCWKNVQGGDCWVGDSRVPGSCHNLLRARSELSTAQ